MDNMLVPISCIHLHPLPRGAARMIEFVRKTSLTPPGIFKERNKEIIRVMADQIFCLPNQGKQILPVSTYIPDGFYLKHLHRQDQFQPKISMVTISFHNQIRSSMMLFCTVQKCTIELQKPSYLKNCRKNILDSWCTVCAISCTKI